MVHAAGENTSYNSATVSASWTSAIGADEIMSKAIQTMRDLNNPNFNYTGSNTSDGQRYAYQFNITPDVGSTTVFGAFQNAIKTNLPTPSSVSSMPTTKIESQFTVIG